MSFQEMPLPSGKTVWVDMPGPESPVEEWVKQDKQLLPLWQYPFLFAFDGAATLIKRNPKGVFLVVAALGIASTLYVYQNNAVFRTTMDQVPTHAAQIFSTQQAAFVATHQAQEYSTAAAAATSTAEHYEQSTQQAIFATETQVATTIKQEQATTALLNTTYGSVTVEAFGASGPFQFDGGHVTRVDIPHPDPRISFWLMPSQSLQRQPGLWLGTDKITLTESGNPLALQSGTDFLTADIGDGISLLAIKTNQPMTSDALTVADHPYPANWVAEIVNGHGTPIIGPDLKLAGISLNGQAIRLTPDHITEISSHSAELARNTDFITNLVHATTQTSVTFVDNNGTQFTKQGYATRIQAPGPDVFMLATNTDLFTPPEGYSLHDFSFGIWDLDPNTPDPQVTITDTRGISFEIRPDVTMIGIHSQRPDTQFLGALSEKAINTESVGTDQTAMVMSFTIFTDYTGTPHLLPYVENVYIPSPDACAFIGWGDGLPDTPTGAAVVRNTGVIIGTTLDAGLGNRETGNPFSSVFECTQLTSPDLQYIWKRMAESFRGTSYDTP